MSMNRTTITLETDFGVTIDHDFYQPHQPGSKLMIILPGRGYQVEHPALYYTLLMGLENGFDVLPIRYGFQVNHTSFELSQMPLLVQDVNAAVQQVLPNNYQDICIVGKSLGTPLAADLATRLNAPRKSQILLTPVPLALQMPPSIPTLAIIGTADSFYDKAPISQTPEIEWLVLDDLDHSFLKSQDWRASVQAQYTILERCDQFIRDKHSS